MKIMPSGLEGELEVLETRSRIFLPLKDELEGTADALAKRLGGQVTMRGKMRCITYEQDGKRLHVYVSGSTKRLKGGCEAGLDDNTVSISVPARETFNPNKIREAFNQAYNPAKQTEESD